MQFTASALLIVSLLPVFGFAAPAASSASGKARSSSATASSTAGASASTGASTGTGNVKVSDTQIANAVLSWMNDTAKVSKFLNTATALSGDDFTKQATIALNAEKDELNHKKVLDDALGQMASVQSANDVLMNQGTFQAVVDALQQMVNDGPDTAQAQVNAINQNRCVNVLPNIDMYFAAAGSASIMSARPTGCLEIDGANVSPAANAAAAGSSSSSAASASITAAPKSSGGASGGASGASGDSSSSEGATSTSGGKGASKTRAAGAAKTTAK